VVNVLRPRCVFKEMDGKAVCINCGRRVKIRRTPVHRIIAACKVGVIPPDKAAFEVPDHVLQHRREQCNQCDHYMVSIDACTLIELGCRNAFAASIKLNRFACPIGKFNTYECLKTPSSSSTVASLHYQVPVDYVTVAKLVDDTLSAVQKLPSGISGVIGVPRSGMIPASILSTLLHIPLYTLKDYQPVKVSSGRRMQTHSSEDGKLLLVDDSIGSGFQIRQLRKNVSGFDDMIKLVVYVPKEKDHLVDLFARHQPLPHCFEWNIVNSPLVTQAGLDMDGFICEDITHEPKHIPRAGLAPAIITARPENEREKTETWLRDQGAKYSELVMWPRHPDERTLQSVAEWKAKEVRDRKLVFYVESDPILADEIRKHHIWVLCPDQKVMR
jgi:hypothetical protein